MRELPGMITIAIASIALVVFGLSTETMASASIEARDGLDRVHHPLHARGRGGPRSSPQSRPMIMPTKVPMPTASSPTHSEMRLP